MGGGPRQSPKEGKGCKGSQPHQSPTPKGDTELAEKLKRRGQGSQGIQRSQNSSMSENGEDPLMSCSLSGPWDQAVGPLGKEASPILAAQGKDKLLAERWCPPHAPLWGPRVGPTWGDTGAHCGGGRLQGLEGLLTAALLLQALPLQVALAQLLHKAAVGTADPLEQR